MTTKCTDIGLRAPGVGRHSVLRGTCHMLPESVLKQKPVNASRPARRPFPERGEGSPLEGVEVVMRAFVCAADVAIRGTQLPWQPRDKPTDSFLPVTSLRSTLEVLTRRKIPSWGKRPGCCSSALLTAGFWWTGRGAGCPFTLYWRLRFLLVL